MRSTRAGSTWRQVRLPDYDYEYYESIYVIENLCSIRDNDYDNYYDIEDLGDVDGDSDCFSAY